MTGAQWGILLLCADLGDGVRPLTLGQVKRLRRGLAAGKSPGDKNLEVTAPDLAALGFPPEEQDRILKLLGREEAVSRSLARAEELGIYPLIWGAPDYPAVLYRRLGEDSPPVLFTRGNRTLLAGPCVSLVGSRRLSAAGAEFARRAGTCAALEGLVLCSGNAEGADRTAQGACLRAGGQVIALTADRLAEHPAKSAQILYLSETGWNLPFSTARALSRNRIIHAMGDKVLVAQTDHGFGGTWQGTADNLRRGRTPVFVHADGSPGAEALIALGATAVEELYSITALTPDQTALF